MRRSTAVAVGTVLLCALAACDRPPRPAGPTATRPADRPTGSPSTAPAATAAAPSARTEPARATIARLIAGYPAGSVSVAARNTVTGARFSAGATSGMWAASVYKLLVLETLLLRHQQAGTALTPTETARATRMIENSDNEDAYDLFVAAGGNAGLASAAPVLGLQNTRPGRADPTLTTTSARDCLRLLGNLVAPGPLAAVSRAFGLGLLRHVQADQRWGVGVVADPGTPFANKNGWLAVDDTNGPGEDDGDRWVVNSVGIVHVQAQPVLISILTRHQDSFSDGVELVETLARAVRATVAP